MLFVGEKEYVDIIDQFNYFHNDIIILVKYNDYAFQEIIIQFMGIRSMKNKIAVFKHNSHCRYEQRKSDVKKNKVITNEDSCVSKSFVTIV